MLNESNAQDKDFFLHFDFQSKNLPRGTARKKVKTDLPNFEKKIYSRHQISDKLFQQHRVLEESLNKNAI